MSKSIYDLKLHEFVVIDKTETEVASATRVPGGWIYTLSMTAAGDAGLAHSQSSVFVPFSDEFNQKKGSGFSINR